MNILFIIDHVLIQSGHKKYIAVYKASAYSGPFYIILSW